MLRCVQVDLFAIIHIPERLQHLLDLLLLKLIFPPKLPYQIDNFISTFFIFLNISDEILNKATQFFLNTIIFPNSPLIILKIRLFLNQILLQLTQVLLQHLPLSLNRYDFVFLCRLDVPVKGVDGRFLIIDFSDQIFTFFPEPLHLATLGRFGDGILVEIVCHDLLLEVRNFSFISLVFQENFLFLGQFLQLRRNFLHHDICNFIYFQLFLLDQFKRR